MIISGFDWDDENIFHIDRHQFTPDEVEEVFVPAARRFGERVSSDTSLWETIDGRLAFVVFRRLRGGVIRVITARDMEDNERRLFRRK